ncbi:MAG: SPOR domain-containing protein [bacterium]
MKKLMILGVIILFLFCAPKKTTVKTEGLEEVVVFGEEEKNVSEEPVYPTPAPAPTESLTPAPAPAEEAIPPAPTEEVSKVTPPVEEVTTPAPAEIPALPPIEEVSVAPPSPATTPLPIEEVSTPAPLPPAPVTTTVPATVYGFRVQIFASSTQKGANKVADDARGVFGGKVYIEHTPPYYKVRVGDCLTKEEAEALKNLAIKKGFRGAFIVETMITP